MVMIVGANATARAMAAAAKRRGGLLTLASHEYEEAGRIAHDLECRHIRFEGLYTTAHDVLVVCDDESTGGKARRRADWSGIHPGYLRPGMTVMDLTGAGMSTSLLREAQALGCRVITPMQALLRQVAAQALLIIGKETPPEVLEQTVRTVLDEEP
jgi:shikimate dehydrogenase